MTADKENVIYQVYKKVKVYSNVPALFIWKQVKKSTWNKYPKDKRKVIEL